MENLSAEEPFLKWCKRGGGGGGRRDEHLASACRQGVDCEEKGKIPESPGSLSIRLAFVVINS